LPPSLIASIEARTRELPLHLPKEKESRGCERPERVNHSIFQTEIETLSVAFHEKEVELIRIKTLNEGRIEKAKSADKQKRMRVQTGTAR
jgi:hypothetical protein